MMLKILFVVGLIAALAVLGQNAAADWPVLQQGPKVFYAGRLLMIAVLLVVGVLDVLADACGQEERDYKGLERALVVSYFVVTAIFYLATEGISGVIDYVLVNIAILILIFWNPLRDQNNEEEEEE